MKRAASLLLAFALAVSALGASVIPVHAAAAGMGSRVIEGGQRDFKWPVPSSYVFSSCFLDPDAKSGGIRSDYHYAIDISASKGAAVVASYPGTVVKAVDGGTDYYGDGFGNYVAIAHQYPLPTGTVTLYSKYNHLNAVSVAEGDQVEAGQVIGEVGNTGFSYGDHLDYQILLNDWSSGSYKQNAIDPYANDLLELPDALTVAATTACCKTYIEAVRSQYAATQPEKTWIAARFFSHGAVTVCAEETTLRTMPCLQTDCEESAAAGTAAKGDRLQVVGLVRNTAGLLWYEVAAEGEKIYLFAGDTENFAQDLSDVKAVAISKPEEHLHGDKFDVRGVIVAEHQTLTQIYTWVENPDDPNEKITGTAVSADTQQYDLASKELDYAVKFRTVPLGTHIYTVGAYVRSYYAENAEQVASVEAEMVFCDHLFHVVEEKVEENEGLSGDPVIDAALELLYRNEGSYGSVNRDDNGALSIGKIQWHAGRALSLLRTIVDMDPEAAQIILGSDLYEEVETASSWSSRTLTAAEGAMISSLLTTDNGKKAQDELAIKDVSVYINHGRDLGLTDVGALIYFADLENQGGYGMSRRVARAALEVSETVSLELLHETALADSVAGKYTSRRNRTYEFCLGYVGSEDSAGCLHNYVGQVTEPTCTQQGYTTFTCTFCENSYVSEEVPSLGHSVTYSLTVLPAFETEGVLSGSCAACGEVQQLPLPPLNRTDYILEVLQEPTPESEGLGLYSWKVTAFGEFSFEAPIPNVISGDANGDWKVDILDLMKLANYLADPTLSIYLENADMDGRPGVDILDLMYLANMLARQTTAD